MEQPLVSIITPTYKRHTDLLQDVISMVKAQTYKNIEHIIIDDNPPDSDYRKEVESFMKNYCDDPSVVYLQNAKNIGGAMSRNVGIFAAKGEYITLLDDDDGYKPVKVEVQVRFMQKERCDMSFTNIMMVDSIGNAVDFRDYSFVKSFDNESLLRYHIMKNLTGTSGFMFRADALKRIGGFDDCKMSQEFMLMLKSIEQGLKIRHLDRCDLWGIRDSAMEQVSQGMNKINGEIRLFNIKKKYYPKLTLRDRMFVRFRHKAVMTVAYRRNKMYGKMLLSAFQMCVYSPLDCVKEAFIAVVNVIKHRKDKQRKATADE